MPASIRLIRGRLKSVKNTKKITKAMELVSAAKMRKAVSAVLASRPYATIARQAVRAMTKKLEEGVTHPLLTERRDVRRALFIVFTSDKGLCGGFNAQLLKKTEQAMREYEAKGIEVKIVAIGKRGGNYFRNRPDKLVSVFTNLSNNPSSLEIRPIGKIAVDGFIGGTYDRVLLAYTDFKSPLVQTPRVMPLLPLGEDDALGAVGGDEKKEETAAGTGFVFEPDPKTLLDLIVPRLAETLLYQALLESSASEHSARMMNMKNATSSATDMINDLTFVMNQARQAGITREISEISAGKAALE